MVGTGRMRQAGRYALAAIVAGVLAVFLLWPILCVISNGFFDRGALTTWWIRRVFTGAGTREGLVNAAQVAVWTTALSLLLGVPLAVLADRVDFRGKTLATSLLLAPMILPPFVGALGFRALFGAHWGSINVILARLGWGQVDLLGGGNKFWIVVVLEALHLYPIIYLNAASALANIDPAMSEAARNLGASRWRVLWRITLPLMRPGLFAGATIVFIWSFCELGTPLMLDVQELLPVQIYEDLRRVDPSTKTFAMVFVMLASSVGLYATGKLLFGRAAAAPVGRANVTAARRRAGWGAGAACWAAFGGITFAAVLPHIGVVLNALAATWDESILPTEYTLRYFAEVYRDERTWRSILNSLRYAGTATVACALLALAVSYLVVRLRVRGGGLLDAASMLPLATPGLVMAAGYVAISARGMPLEAIGPHENPFVLLVIAYTIRRLPYMVRSLSAGLQQVPETLEEAARNLGASRLGAVVRVTLPLIAANILAGGILAFSFNMLEVSDSLVLAQRTRDYPITKQLFELAGEQPKLASALGVYGMVLLGGTILAANTLLGRRMGQLFRV